MSDERIVEATFWAMIAVQTIGSVDMPGSGERKLPSPHVYVSIVVLWAILGALADSGLARAASRLSILVLLTASVLGPFGARAVSFLQSVGSRFALTSPTIAVPTSTNPGG